MLVCVCVSSYIRWKRVAVRVSWKWKMTDILMNTHVCSVKQACRRATAERSHLQTKSCIPLKCGAVCNAILSMPEHSRKVCRTSCILQRNNKTPNNENPEHRIKRAYGTAENNTRTIIYTTVDDTYARINYERRNMHKCHIAAGCDGDGVYLWTTRVPLTLMWFL